MSLEGLNAILNKEEVIVTRLSHDFIERPKTVDDTYTAHLRTYVPMHGGSVGEQASVEGFTKRFIQHTLDRRVPRGYVTADFGYGKTSTGLYVWGEATRARLLAVPPFQLGSLTDLINATAGWVYYALGNTKPSLQSQAEDIYQKTVAHSIADIAARYSIPVEAAAKMIEDKPQIMELSSADIVRFIRAMTNLVVEAGFVGLIIIADEVQQYLEPEIKAGKRDPVGPLFDLVNDLGAQNDVPCGLLLIIPQKEVSVINDQRGDLIDRMRNYVLDLKTIYDQDFPNRLWSHLAKTFKFDSIAGRILCKETLLSLGELAVRNDLANGPRTVVNVFRRAIRLYMSSGELGHQPYTPITLVNDFLSGAIAFDGEKRMQTVVARALEHPFVKEAVHRSEAVLLAGAFPTNGVATSIQAVFGLQNAFYELRERTYGDVVIHVGNPADPGTALVGLQVQKEPVKWLVSAIQDFSRNYYENAANVKQRVLNSFKAVLASLIFKTGWKTSDSFDSSIVSSAGINFEGAFAAFKREFPERSVHVCIVFDDEPTRSIDGEFDVIFQFRLNRYLELDASARQNRVTTPAIDEDHYTAHLSLNLARRIPEAMNRAVEPILTKVIASERLNPLFLLALHGYFDNLNATGRVPKPDQPSLVNQFMPALLESALDMMLDRAVGAPFDAVGAKLIETLTTNILRTRYGNHYHTLMGISTWRNALRDYSNKLNRLENSMQRQGVLPFEGTKEQIVRQLNLGSTIALDTFMSNFPELLEQVSDFKRAKTGAVRFTLHPLEEDIRTWVSQSTDTITANAQTLRRLPYAVILARAKRLGYKPDEVELLLQVMSDRELINKDKAGNIVEQPAVKVSIDDVRAQVNLLTGRIRTIEQTFPEATEISRIAENCAKLLQLVSQLGRHPDPKALAQIDVQSRNNLKHADNIFNSNLERIKATASRLPKRFSAITIPPFDPLLNVVDNVPYAEPLETVRVDLTIQHTQYKDRLVVTREHVQQITEELTNGTYTQDKLPQLVKEIRSADTQVETLAANAAALAGRITAYSAWGRAAQTHDELLDALKQLGSDATSLRSQLEQIEAEMIRRLSTAWFDALPDGDMFERRLKVLQKQVREVEEQANNRFKRLQDSYQRMLREAKCPQDSLWSAIVYSPIDQVLVYEHLYRNATQATLASLDNADNQIQHWCSDLRQRMAAPDGNQIRVHAEQIIQELDTIKARIPYRSDLAESVRDFDGNQGAFIDLMRSLHIVWTQLSPFSDRIANLLRPHEAPEFTPVDMTLLSLLKEPGVPTDLADVWEAAQKAGIDTIWVPLRSLWEKGILEIRVKRKP